MTPPTVAKAEKKHLHVRFRARWIPALAQWLNDDIFEHHEYGSIQIDPADDGGCDLIASDGSSMLWVHEPKEHGKATEQVFLSVPDALARVCEEPPAPPLIDVNGFTPDITMPAWTRPGYLTVCGLGDGEDAKDQSLLVYVQPWAQPPTELVKGHKDGYGLYSVTQDVDPLRKPLPWRKVFEREIKPTGAQSFNPLLLGRLAKISELFRGRAWRMGQTGPEGPVLFESPELDGAFARALIMPMLVPEAK